MRLVLLLTTLLSGVAVGQRPTVESIFDNIDKDYNKNVPPPTTGRKKAVMIGITVTNRYVAY